METKFKGMSPLSFIFKPTCNYSQNFQSFHNVIFRPLNDNVVKIIAMKSIDTFESQFKRLYPKAFYQYYCQPSHDSKKCLCLKIIIHDLINSNPISIRGDNDQFFFI